ncbi:hypothetical protein [Micromonospora sp. IBHARD004]|uniref:hypothetical protein n=1 Tax=Micromonospora sp. IBHARD004 TaxID=3457764 RepID=UPI00405A0AB5
MTCEAEQEGAPPRPGDKTVEANLRAYLRRAPALHAAILPAFAGLTTQPGHWGSAESRRSDPPGTARCSAQPG